MTTQKIAPRKCARHDCKAWAVRGATVCVVHGAKAPQVRKKAAIREELARWTLGDPVADPGETLLRLITQSRARASMYAAELERLVGNDPDTDLTDVLTGTSKVWTGESLSTTGEYIRAIVVLEAEERDRCAKFCTLAIGAGLAERMVKVAERQAETVAAAVRAALDDSGLAEDVRRMVVANVGRRLREIAS